MAIDKAVDSAVLESNLTAVADAIRAKTGGSDPLAFPSGMVDAIAGITSGGGAELPTAKLLCTLATDMNVKELLTAHPVPVEYEKCIVFIKQVGQNAPTTGSYSLKWVAYFVQDQGTNCGELRCQVADLLSPDSMKFWETGSTSNGSYADVVDNYLTASANTNSSRYLGAGNSVYYLCIPFDFENMSMVVEKR